MQFSVVMPLFNKAPHVEAAIRSALDQSLAPHEIIVVDDGSSDGSREIAQAIGDSRIKLLDRSPPGPGGYAARNLGIETASGEWIAFLDADDRWKPNHLESMAAAIGAAGSPVGCAFSGVEIVTGSARRRYPQSARHLSSGRALGMTEILRAWLETKRCPFWTGGSAFRRELLVRAGLFPAGRARRGGDKDLWLRSIALAPAAFSPGATAEFHQDAVNRVSVLTRHSELPILVDTIAAMLPATGPEDARLLRQLSNQEIVQYARYAGGAGTTDGFRFVTRLHYPDGLAAAFKVVAYSIGGLFLRSAGAIKRGRSAAR